VLRRQEALQDSDGHRSRAEAFGFASDEADFIADAV
jgi:hypothetical protein